MSEKHVVKRLAAVSVVEGAKVVDYLLPQFKSGPYIVDDSGFCPMSEAVKQLSRTAPISSDEVKMYYDFPNGKDTGMKVPVQRSGHMSDITELTQEVRELQKEVKDNIDNISKAVKEQQAISDAMQSAAVDVKE